MKDLNTEKNDEISIADLYGYVKSYIVYIVLISIIFGLGGYLYTKLMVKPVYESSATLIVNNRKDEGSSSITNDEINSAKNLANVYGIIIKSDAVMQPVVTLTESTLTSQALARKVTVTAVNNTQIIKVSVRDTNPEKARLYANEIINIAPEIIVDMVEVGSAKVVSYPQVPTSPVSPNTRMNVLIAGVMGLLLSSGFVVLRQLLDKTFKSVDDIEDELGVPVIGVIPNVDSVRRGK